LHREYARKIKEIERQQLVTTINEDKELNRLGANLILIGLKSTHESFEHYDSIAECDDA